GEVVEDRLAGPGGEGLGALVALPADEASALRRLPVLVGRGRHEPEDDGRQDHPEEDRRELRLGPSADALGGLAQWSGRYGRYRGGGRGGFSLVHRRILSGKRPRAPAPGSGRARGRSAPSRRRERSARAGPPPTARPARGSPSGSSRAARAREP